MNKIILRNGEECLVSPQDFHWINQRNWYLHAAGYAMCDLWGRRGSAKVLMHRLILLAPDTATVDHINGNVLDNRRENLRLATQSEQNMNRHKIVGVSKFKGVYRRSDGLKWVAMIKKNYQRKYLGCFENEIDAALAYNKAAIELHGSFAKLNNIGEVE